ncbi:MAG: NFACT family protein [Trueperaceae bacterium]
MEGLLLAQTLDPLRDRLPAERLAWRFAGPNTAVLPLVPDGALWIFDRLPNPRVELRRDQPSGPSAPRTGFQALLASRAAGLLVSVEQPALDRVCRLRFGAGRGFVETGPVELIVELTGRNGNLILVDPDGTILGAAREIDASVNRFRQVRPGLPYRPPPPYRKSDPRTLPADGLREALEGGTPKQVKKRLDGIGPELTRAAVRLARVPDDAELTGEALDAFVSALQQVIRDPRGAAERALDRPDVATLRRRERREADLRVVRAHLQERRQRAAKRIGDAERALRAADDAARLRTEADLLLAHAHAVPGGSEHVTLPDFEGGETVLTLDPSRSVAANAKARYENARKRENRAERALARSDELEAERAEVDRELARLDQRSDEELARRAAALTTREREDRKRPPGLSYPGPHGFPVLVGRSARENDAITFRVARSRDVWLHVQGWHGAHVLIRSGGAEVPFDTVLFAARLAAGHSKASGGDNVPVDYTERKNVWKVKGGPPGAVQYAHQKTVYVTPSRNPNAERAVSDA